MHYFLLYILEFLIEEIVLTYYSIIPSVLCSCCVVSAQLTAYFHSLDYIFDLIQVGRKRESISDLYDRPSKVIISEYANVKDHVIGMLV